MNEAQRLLAHAVVAAAAGVVTVFFGFTLMDAIVVGAILIGTVLIAVGPTLGDDDELYADPPLEDEPRGEMPPRGAIFGVTFVVGAGIAIQALCLPDLDRELRTVYALGVVVVAAAVGALLHRAGKGGARS